MRPCREDAQIEAIRLVITVVQVDAHQSGRYVYSQKVEPSFLPEKRPGHLDSSDPGLLGPEADRRRPRHHPHSQVRVSSGQSVASWLRWK